MHQVQAQYMVKGAGGGGEYGFGGDQTQQAMQHRNKSGDHRQIEKD